MLSDWVRTAKSGRLLSMRLARSRTAGIKAEGFKAVRTSK